MTDLGKSGTSISLQVGDLNRVKLEAVSLGIYSYNQKEGDFQVMVKSIEAIYREEFEDLREKYPFPVMFKRIVKDGVDTGRGVLRFQKFDLEE